MLHLGEIQDDGREGDEDQIEESQGGDEVRGLTEVGTSKKHLKQNLERREALQLHVESFCCQRKVSSTELAGLELSLHVFLPCHLHVTK